MDAPISAARCGRSAAAAAIVFACLSVQAEPATYRVDPARSVVRFEVVNRADTSNIRGRFGAVQGHVELDRQAARGRVDITIATSSVSTGLRGFDKRLRSGDLLATKEHPQAHFVSDRFIFEAGVLKEVQGDFTLRGVTRPLALKTLRFACGRHPQSRREVCSAAFEADFKRSDYGASYGLPMIPDHVRLSIAVEGVRQ